MASRVMMSALACAAILYACAGGCSRVVLPESARYELHLDFIRPDGTVVKTMALPKVQTRTTMATRNRVLLPLPFGFFRRTKKPRRV